MTIYFLVVFSRTFRDLECSQRWAMMIMNVTLSTKRSEIVHDLLDC
jgi:hypothetical protein